jgi:hypothetical protein
MLMLNTVRWTGNLARISDKRNARGILAESPEGKSPVFRSMFRWVDNIKMNLEMIGCDCMDWIYLAQDRNQSIAPVNKV